MWSTVAVPVLAADMSPSIIPIVVIGVAVMVVSIGLVVAVAKCQGPGPADTAVAYEQAWDRLDFATLWNLSSPHQRDGRSRADFVRDKQQAYESEGSLTRLVRSVRPDRVEVNGPVARVFTRLDLANDQTILNEMLLERLGGNWLVTAYHIASPRH